MAAGRFVRRVIGLLGGSFNPAHAGHVHISLYALKKLRIDEIWWLVSPHNPLKAKNSLADYGTRFASAREITRGHRRIRVSDIEARRALRYSWQTIALLQKKYPRVRFVWLMGADNLAGFHRWARWRQILAMLPVVVFDRAPFSYTAVASPAAAYSRRFLLKDSGIDGSWPAPSLHFARLSRAPQSATALRKTLGKCG